MSEQPTKEQERKYDNAGAVGWAMLMCAAVFAIALIVRWWVST